MWELFEIYPNKEQAISVKSDRIKLYGVKKIICDETSIKIYFDDITIEIPADRLVVGFEYPPNGLNLNLVKKTEGHDRDHNFLI